MFIAMACMYNAYSGNVQTINSWNDVEEIKDAIRRVNETSEVFTEERVDELAMMIQAMPLPYTLRKLTRTVYQNMTNDEISWYVGGCEDNFTGYIEDVPETYNILTEYLYALQNPDSKAFGIEAFKKRYVN